MNSEGSALTEIRALQTAGKRLVALSGTFDFLHYGHLFFLTEAKRRGDALVVFLNSDVSVKRYKGDARPTHNEHERREMLEALRVVDFVVIFNEDTPVRLIEEVKPDIYCNGSDWGEHCPEKSVVDAYGGTYCVIPLQKGYSTTQLIERIKEQ